MGSGERVGSVQSVGERKQKGNQTQRLGVSASSQSPFDVGCGAVSDFRSLWLSRLQRWLTSFLQPASLSPDRCLWGHLGLAQGPASNV